MTHKYSQPIARRLMISLCSVLAAIALLLITTVGVLANTVHVYDNAGVLNVAQVQQDAATLPYPIDIYTVNNFNGTKAQFEQRTASHTANNPQLIVLAIDTVHHFVYIVGGSNVPLASSQATNAANTFANAYKNGGYTGATTAAIDSLRNQLGASPAPGGGSGNAGVPGTSGQNAAGLSLPAFGGLCCIGLLVLAGIALFGIFRARRRALGPVPMGPVGSPYQQPYNQGYPPNYYGPGYNQGSGINPLAAGGLGAAAGGLIGYELGKEQGEDQARGQGNSGNLVGGDFGSGGGADFGGGGGGGDFGGGGGADFGGGGGGGDFGGGGGGDFGGGGGSNF